MVPFFLRVIIIHVFHIYSAVVHPWLLIETQEMTCAKFYQLFVPKTHFQGTVHICISEYVFVVFQDFCNDSIERLNATLGVYTTRRTRPPVRTTLPTRPPQRTTKPTTTAQPENNNIGMWGKVHNTDGKIYLCVTQSI